MFSKVAIALVLSVVLLGAAAIFAVDGQDDQGNPNDPFVNARANACYDGGTIENKCVSDWDWTCGWYLIRINAGIISRTQFPEDCISLIGEIEATIIPEPMFTPLPSSTPLPI